MKGLKKCFLFSFILMLASLVSSLGIYSQNTYAKKWEVHDFLAIPPANNYLAPTFSVGLIDLYSEFDDLKPMNVPRLVADSLTNGKCVINDGSYRSPGYSVYNSVISWDNPGLIYNYYNPTPHWSYPANDSLAICNTVVPYGTDFEYNNQEVKIPKYDDQSNLKKINVNSMLPWNFMFSRMPFSGYREIDGVEYSARFDLSDLFGNLSKDNNAEDYEFYNDIINRVSLPLSFDSSLEDIQAGTTIQISGAIEFSEGLTTLEWNNLGIEFHLNSVARDGQNGSQRGVSDCVKSDQNLNPNRMEFICTGSIPANIDAGRYNFDFHLYREQGNSYPYPAISATKQHIYFDTMSIILNDDDTPGGDGDFYVQGSFPNVAPGVPEYHSDPNLIGTLTNLFGFSFINPFYPLFNMFTSGSQCANIPILAGMLNSNETTYCSWFSSTTRDILTPVLSISAMMLIFGFAVRWLGSSSGNMTEDDTNGKDTT